MPERLNVGSIHSSSYLNSIEFLHHLIATMLGAFFIATDPVSASTTPKGRLIYGFLIGVLIVIIRTFGGYPDQETCVDPCLSA
jgi:Na+-translocating ferredoxin:NAD+ oxidoreductase RnfD subunit